MWQQQRWHRALAGLPPPLASDDKARRKRAAPVCRAGRFHRRRHALQHALVEAQTPPGCVKAGVHHHKAQVAPPPGLVKGAEELGRRGRGGEAHAVAGERGGCNVPVGHPTPHSPTPPHTQNCPPACTRWRACNPIPPPPRSRLLLPACCFRLLLLLAAVRAVTTLLRRARPGPCVCQRSHAKSGGQRGAHPPPNLPTARTPATQVASGHASAAPSSLHSCQATATTCTLSPAPTRCSMGPMNLPIPSPSPPDLLAAA